MASPSRTRAIGGMSTAGCSWTLMTWRSWGRRYLLTEAGTVSVFGASLIAHRALKRREEAGKPVGHRGEEGPDVVHHVSGSGGIFDDPPKDKRDSQPPEDCLKIHVASQRRPDSSCSSGNQC